MGAERIDYSSDDEFIQAQAWEEEAYRRRTEEEADAMQQYAEECAKDEICNMFACVYAIYSGCVIEGWTGEEGPLNGKKERCPHYDAQCINAKCRSCGHNGGESCRHTKEGKEDKKV